MANPEMQDLVEIQDNKAKSASKVHLVLLDQLETLDLPASQDGTDNRDNQEEMVKRVAERLELKDNPVAQDPQDSLAKTDNPEPQASKAHPDQQETKANQASPDPRDIQVALDPLDCPARTQHTVLAHHAVPSSFIASNNRRQDVRKTNTTKLICQPSPFMRYHSLQKQKINGCSRKKKKKKKKFSNVPCCTLR
jgi:hypothetical protein